MENLVEVSVVLAREVSALTLSRKAVVVVENVRGKSRTGWDWASLAAIVNRLVTGRGGPKACAIWGSSDVQSLMVPLP